MYKSITTLDELHRFIADHPAVLVYYSQEACSVCRVLKPKIGELFRQSFPKVERVFVDISLSPEISGQESIFTVPTMILYLEGREFIRESRNVSLQALEKKVRRPYEMLMASLTGSLNS